ncbi:MAG: hypothetical protein COA73_06470 [Candidatus Hydrogenedentota bacterium]|nr:MAG: hypothetical protein COA73_06470 [Candidatus Hydrogenedentota bacterium]
MLMKTIQHDQDGIHVDFYEPMHHKEGHLDLHFNDPAFTTRIQPDDVIRIFGLDDVHTTAADKMKVLLVHADGTKELLPCKII